MTRYIVYGTITLLASVVVEADNEAAALRAASKLSVSEDDVDYGSFNGDAFIPGEAIVLEESN